MQFVPLPLDDEMKLEIGIGHKEWGSVWGD